MKGRKNEALIPGPPSLTLLMPGGILGGV